MCKNTKKRSFMTNLMKRQIWLYEATFLLINLDNFWHQNQWEKLSGKTHSYYCIYVWFKNKRVWTEKIGIWRKRSKGKVLEFCLRLFASLIFFVRPKFEIFFRMKADKNKGRGWRILLFRFIQPKNILVSNPHTFQSVPSSFS